MSRATMHRIHGVFLVGLAAATLAAAPNATETPAYTAGLPDHAALRQALTAVRQEANGGLDLDMWATVVDRGGRVVAVAHTGKGPGDQWPGSRVISAQKANTANAFSLPKLALSSANLYAATQPGGSLFGLQESNPVDPRVAYDGDTEDFGTPRDPMKGKRIGGINVFGGGVALYDAQGNLIGALGVSGDTSCADHNIAWKLRARLGLDHVPAGVSPTKDDNIVYDIGADGRSASGFGHPVCSAEAKEVAAGLPRARPASSGAPKMHASDR